MKILDWEKYKIWIYTGALVIPTACYFTYKLYRAREMTKLGQFEKGLRYLRNLVSSKRAKAENILALKKVSTMKMSEITSELEFEVHLVENILNKEGAGKRDSRFKKEDPFLPPFERGMYITDLGNHRILFNKFPLIKNHVLVVTKAFEEQHSVLSASDFESSYLTMRALNGLAFYNSGPNSGASQPHRHVQIIPLTRETKTSIVKEIFREAQESVKEEEEFFMYSQYSKIKHFVMNLKPFDPEEESLAEYSEYLYEVYIELLNLLENRELQNSYNLLMTDKWMMGVVRDRGRAFDRFGVNAAGFTGSLLVKNAQDLQDFSSKNPSDVLRDICSPNFIEDVD